jgi:precorrin-2/cobalt-factor-2 C20-methyltransferase
MTSRCGTLYGIGVGPGDPDLVTLKAVKVLRRVQVVFAASSTRNDHSQAVRIAAAHIPPGTEVRRLPFPMTRDREQTLAAWRTNAQTLIAELRAGRDVAFLTLGDALTYSTFGYVLRQVQHMAPEIRVETVPGITSYQAAAACLNRPLVEGDEALLVLSGASGGQRLRQMGVKPENVVFLKAYRHLEDICQALAEVDMLKTSSAVVNCGLENQAITDDLAALCRMPPQYWTLVIAQRRGASSDETPQP